LVPVFVLTAIIAGLFVPLLSSDRAIISVACVGSLGACVVMYLAVYALAPHLLVPRLILLAYALQLFWLLAVGMLGLRTYSINSFAPEITEFPLRATLPNLLVPVSVLLAVGLIRLLPLRLREKSDLWQQNRDAPSGIGFFLVVAAGLCLLHWLAVSDPESRAFYFVRILNRAFTFVPLLAGRYSRQLAWARYAWLAAIAINCMIGLAVGERVSALLPGTLFVLGYFLSTPTKKKFRSAVLLTALAVPVFVLSGVAGVVRGRIGRGGIEMFTADRLGAIVESASDLLQATDESTRHDIALDAIGRMVVWPNLTVVMLTPEAVPYRGLSTLPKEIVASTKIGYLTGISRQHFYDLGLGSTPARLYGYTVSTQSSVEFGVLADGWSRGGIPVVLGFGVVITLALSLLEHGLQVLRGWSPCSRLLMLVVLFTPALGVATETLLNVLRTAVLYLSFIMTGAWVMEKLALYFDPHRRI
jgi:hypothetical protein